MEHHSDLCFCDESDVESYDNWLSAEEFGSASDASESETVHKPEASLKTGVKAAKNDRQIFKNEETISDQQMERLMQKVFTMDAVYDAAIDSYLWSITEISKNCDIHSDRIRIKTKWILNPEKIPDSEEEARNKVTSAKTVLISLVKRELKTRGFSFDQPRLLSRMRKRLKYYPSFCPRNIEQPLLALSEGQGLLERFKMPIKTSPAISWPVSDQKTMKPLSEVAQDTALLQLSTLIEEYMASLVFSCGGKLPISYSNQQHGYPPIQLHWPLYGNVGERPDTIVFPCSVMKAEMDESQYMRLLSRHTLKMNQIMGNTGGTSKQNDKGKIDTGNLYSSFDPEKLGILEQMASILLPSFDRFEIYNVKSLRAKLKQFNIYSDKDEDDKHQGFQVDDREGWYTLLVRLPSKHQGGEITVSRDGVDQTYQRDACDTTVQWVAFYNDCSYRIGKVSEKFCVILTYFVYFPTKGYFTTASGPSLIETSNCDIHNAINSMLNTPGFMKNGGTFGIFLRYNMEHTKWFGEDQISQVLKRLRGNDRILYEVFNGLGLETKLVPVLLDGHLSGGISVKDLVTKKPELSHQALSLLRNFQSSKKDTTELEKELTLEYMEESIQDTNQYRQCSGSRNHRCKVSGPFVPQATFEENFRTIICNRRVKGLEPSVSWPNVMLGRKFSDTRRMCLSPYTVDDDLDHCIPHVSLPGVIWLNKMNGSNMGVQLLYATMDEEEDAIFKRFSIPAIIVCIPPFKDRNRPQRGTKRSFEATKD